MNEKEFLFSAVQSLRNSFCSLVRLCFHKFGSIPGLSNESVPSIPQELLDNTVLYSDRYVAVQREWPHSSLVLEVGTQTGKFAEAIYNLINPRELHVVDVSYDYFSPDIDTTCKITKHHGFSDDVFPTFKDEYFDVVYIDASHDYNNVIADLKNAIRVTRSQGLIVCNDYVWFSPTEMTEYGVIRAFNEMASLYKLSVKYFALHPHGFFDIAFVKN